MKSDFPNLPFLRVLCVLGVLCGCIADAQVTRPSTRPGGEIVPPSRRDVPGRRITLSTGELFIPDFFYADDKAPADVMIWFLGAPWCAEQVSYDARKNAVLLATNAATLKAGFADAAKFDALLDEVSQSIHRPIGRVCLTSFSGGYTAVRDLLRHQAIADRVTDVVLLDSLYAPRIGDKKDQLDPAALEPFVAFAKRAAEGKAVFIFTHLYPPLEEHRGNTTTLAASFLIDALGAERKPVDGDKTPGRTLLYRADKGGFHVLGFAGMTNQDHFNHFYLAADILSMTSLARPPEAGQK